MSLFTHLGNMKKKIHLILWKDSPQTLPPLETIEGHIHILLSLDNFKIGSKNFQFVFCGELNLLFDFVFNSETIFQKNRILSRFLEIWEKFAQLEVFSSF